MTLDTSRFVASLTPSPAFAEAFDETRYVAVPDGWLVAITDVVRSREAIAAGRYKEVNMAGVAMISAVMNALGTRDVPFIFGGDGAAIVLAPAERDTVAEALAKVRTFAQEELGLEMRASLVPVELLRKRGFDVRIEAVRLSDAVNNFAFTGGGLSEAERLMKRGEFGVDKAPPGVRPDLTGLSCRWTPIRPSDRSIVSMIVEAGRNARPGEFGAIARQLLSHFGFEADAGNPMPAEGPGVAWPVAGIDLEARAARGTGALLPVRIKLFFETLLAWALFRTGLKLGEFDPARYLDYTRANTDFRKVQDGLRMTLALAADEQDALERFLEAQRKEGRIRYGLCVQDSAVITCYVPSISEDSHMHFLDGAGGGYAGAASAMRE